MTADTGQGVETPYSASQRVVFARCDQDMTVASLFKLFRAFPVRRALWRYEARIATLEYRCDRGGSSSRAAEIGVCRGNYASSGDISQ